MTGQRTTRGLFTCAALMICVATPAQAAAQCWNPTQVAAAKVRDLQSRLMVATLRCSAMGVDVAGAYNNFLAANRSTIQGANAVLLAQFQTGFGRQGLVHYDRFATSLANIYGDDATNQGVCADTAAVAEEAAAAGGDIAQLVAIAGRFGAVPELPGGQCSISFASAETN